MAMQKIYSPVSIEKTADFTPNIFHKYLTFVDSQKGNAVMWWGASLLIHGCILVPLTFLLVYSLGGPTLTFLGISMVLFFVNFIGNMGGASFRFNFNSLAISLFLHVVMVVATLAMTL
jgi:hypothetical protein